MNKGLEIVIIVSLVLVLILSLAYIFRKKPVKVTEGEVVYCYSLETQASCDPYPEQPSNMYYCADTYQDCQTALQSLFN